MSPILALFLVAVVPDTPAPPLPVVEADWPALRAQTSQLLTHLETLKASLPAKTAEEIRALLDDDEADPDDASRSVQQLLDAHCLISVSVNPESRVKAARGPRPAHLVRDEPTLLLVKVHNQGGVTHALAVGSAQAVVAGKEDDDRWVEATILNGKPFANRLTGQRLEYRVLRLTPRQTGKREATLGFDVGQGTQDLGFRAEVPILFTIRPRR